MYVVNHLVYKLESVMAVHNAIFLPGLICSLSGVFVLGLCVAPLLCFCLVLEQICG